MNSKLVKIGFVNGKGGTSKTTSCLNLGHALTKLKHRVGILDADRQRSMSAFMSSEANRRDGMKLITDDAALSTIDVLLCDFPPRLDDPKSESLLPKLDLACLVTGDSYAELMTTQITYRHLQLRFPSLKLIALFSRIAPRTVMNKKLDTNLAQLELSDIPRLGGVIRSREQYKHSVAKGWQSLDGDAKSELLELAAEIYNQALKNHG